MMATRTDIEDTIFDGMFDAVGVAPLRPNGLPEENIVWANQPDVDGDSAPQPVGLYMDLNIIAGLSRLGLHDEVRMPPADSVRVEATVVGQREFTLSVQTYGVGAQDVAQGVINYFQKPSVGGALRRAQIDTVEVVTVIDSTVYRIDVGDDKVEITSIIGATFETIRDQLVVAIDALGTITVTAEVAPAEFTLETALGQDLPLSLDAKLAFVAGSHQAAVDIAYLRDSGETPLTDLIDGIYFEPRANVDFFFGTTTNIEDDAGLIETVEITDTSFTGETFSIP